MADADLPETDPLNTLLDTLSYSSLSVASVRRKTRLLMCGCCRRIWHLIPNQWSRRAVEIAEAYADGLVDDKELTAAWYAAYNICEFVNPNDAASYAAWCASETAFDDQMDARRCLELARNAAAAACDEADKEDLMSAEQSAQTVLLRDVVQIPIYADASVISQSVVGHGIAHELAVRIYERREFEALPVLADALEAAAYSNASVLEHFRAKLPHIRGCWALDLVLSKDR